jgi:hypothetical protein
MGRRVRRRLQAGGRNGDTLLAIMGRYWRWAQSSQGAWVTSMLLFLIALFDVLLGNWWLAALLALAGAVNLRRAFKRRSAP